MSYKYDDKSCGAYSVVDEYIWKPMLQPGYDFSQHHTKELLLFLRSQMGREIKELNTLLKNELAKREHIPNKIQAKEIRKQKAKQQKNYG